MNLDDQDPLLEKLRGLPTPKLHQARRAQALDAAEAALPGATRPKARWSEIAMVVTLAITGAMYTVGSVNKLAEIYGSGRLAAVDPER